MSNMIINDLYLLNPADETGKHVSFDKGSNIITSSSVDGNNVGKTTLLKSIYHTLGADCRFDSNWPTKDIIYIVSVDVDGDSVLFYRHDKLHRIYCNNSIIFQTNRKKELSEFLKTRFGLAVYLPKRDVDELELASPAYSYVLNYLDRPEGPHFTSFDKMTEYPSSVKDIIIYNHLGIFDARYYDLKKNIERLIGTKNSTEEKLNVLQILIDRIKTQVIDEDYSSSYESLKEDVDSISREYDTLLHQLSKTKQSIIEYSNQKISLIQQLDSLKKELLSINKNIKAVSADHICPICHSEIDDLSVFRVVNFNQQASTIIMRDELDNELINVNRKLSSLQDTYQELLQQVNRYRTTLRSSKYNSEEIISQEGAIRIRDQFVHEADEQYLNLQGVKEQIKDAKKELKDYDDRINELNEAYHEMMHNSLAHFSIEEIGDDKISKIASNFKATENNTRLVTIVWICSLLKLKAKYNPAAIRLPLMLDSPTFGELDETRMSSLWDYIFNLGITDQQMIITSLDFSVELERKYKVDKIINIETPKYQLLNAEEYKLNISLLEQLENIPYVEN